LKDKIDESCLMTERHNSKRHYELGMEPVRIDFADIPVESPIKCL